MTGSIFLTGCGGAPTNSTTTEPTPSPQPTVAESGELVTEPPSPFSKYDPPITLTFARTVDNDLTDNILPRTPGETIESNRWLDLYSNELGIDIKYNWTVRGGLNDDAYTQKLNVTIASGDLPDVLIVNRTQLKQLAEADMIADMTELYETYASDLTREVYNSEGPGILESAKIGRAHV